MLSISISAEKIGSIGSFPITNSLLATWVVMAILFIISYLATRDMKMVPTGLQSIMEMVIGGFYGFYKTIVGERIKTFYPLILSLFMFIIVANWFGLLPGVGTVGFYEKEKPVAIEEQKNASKESASGESVAEKTVFVPLLRGANADLNMTVALALITIFLVQYYAFSAAGIHYAKRFINLSNPINFFLGLLEILSEVSRIISFAFRLFGNIFAGEVLLAVMAFLMPFIAPLPFLSLELFVGFIQALVFSMLAAVFLTLAVDEGEHFAHAAHSKH
jgi:F-type H+-transporting ATPase subunit a